MIQNKPNPHRARHQWQAWEKIGRRMRLNRWQKFAHKLRWQYETRPQPFLWVVLGSFMLGAILVLWQPDFGNQFLPIGERTLKLALPSTAAEPVPQAQSIARHVLIRSGDRLDSLLSQLAVPPSLQQKINTYRSPILPRGVAGALYAGRTIGVKVNAAGDFESLSVDTDRTTMLVLDLTQTPLKGAKWNKAETWVERVGGGVINASLFATLDESNLPDNIALKVADIFATEIDFSREIRQGDAIWVAYRQLMIDGLMQPDVRVEAVHLLNRKKDYWAFYFNSRDPNRAQQPLNRPASKIQEPTAKDKNTTTAVREINPALFYFNLAGQSLVRGFIRNPLEFSRVSSSFNLSRFHPILNTMRAHTGVDFAAPIGTPVRAVGDGKVKFVGVQKGYGNIIILEHDRQVETRYAHLHGFFAGLKKGQDVSQGQTIAYVGKTGLATGPHLHFEFRINGLPHDPLLVELPHGGDVLAANREKFNALKERYLSLLSLAKDYSRVSLE